MLTWEKPYRTVNNVSLSEMKVRMNSEETSVYTLLIKRLACRHQTGEEYQKIKSDLNDTLMLLSGQIGRDPSERIRAWAGMHTALKCSLMISADPKWIKVIRYAMSRVKIYRQNAQASHAGSLNT